MNTLVLVCENIQNIRDAGCNFYGMAYRVYYVVAGI